MVSIQCFTSISYKSPSKWCVSLLSYNINQHSYQWPPINRTLKQSWSARSTTVDWNSYLLIFLPKGSNPVLNNLFGMPNYSMTNMKKNCKEKEITWQRTLLETLTGAIWKSKSGHMLYYFKQRTIPCRMVHYRVDKRECSFIQSTILYWLTNSYTI